MSGHGGESVRPRGLSPSSTLSIELIDNLGMDQLVVVALAGFLATFVDGALGMGFGPTSSTVLLSGGMAPGAVSTTVNLAKVVTGAAGAISHWRFGNVDRRLVVRLAWPGAAGALVGVTILASVDGDRLRPILAALLLVVGARILYRFSRPLRRAPGGDAAPVAHLGRDRTVTVAGAAGGVTNGLVGAWGPVVTPVLLHKGVPPRYTIGSVNTAEVAVATVAAGSLLASLRGDGIDVGIVLAMLGGGLVAAPVSAWVIRYLPARATGVAVGALLLLTNVRELAAWAGVDGARWLAYAAVVVLAGAAALAPRVAARRARRLAAAG